MKIIDTNEKSRVLIVCLITIENKINDINSYFEEFKSLVKSNNIKPVFEYFSKLRSIDSALFLTKGKFEEIREICMKEDIEEVIISEILSPNQESNLEKELGVKIYDRTHLILEIFEKNAQSAEAKLQTEIAFLEHKKTRVSGRGKSYMQQSGFVGGKGPGETQKEIDLQHIDHLLLKLRKDLQRLKNIKNTQIKQRLKNNIFKISLVGYTNAGKSTLFNNLTKSNVLVEDKLFATLDTTTRELFIDKKKAGLISDTVGFVQNLPHQLIEAFNATLQELKYADLLIHVVDISNKDWLYQIETVNNVLNEINVKDKKMIYVINKIDKVTPEHLEEQKKYLPENSCFIEADKKNTITELTDLLKKEIPILNKKEEFFELE